MCRISIVDFSQSVSGSTAKDIMDLLVMNQYFDTLQEMGNGNAKCVFLAKDTHPMFNSMLEANAGK
ncbi:hypothetical protein EON65_07000 [archaeon]|nr:MAG: hypothetical protein EON65_07000 [archaeon]